MNNNKHKHNFTSIISLVFLGGLLIVQHTAATAEETESQPHYTPRGADTCLQCHDEDYDYPVMTIFFTKHGNLNDPRSPMAGLQCEACHGPGGEHAEEPYVGKERAPIINFGRDTQTSLDKQNSICLTCHSDSKRMAWKASAHSKQDMLCVDCHSIHARKDPVLTAEKQTDTCYTCHQQQQAQFERTSVHPVRYGKMQCSQCHNMHGTLSDTLLVGNTKNELCNPHAPVQEDCGLCHEHHGSIHTPLLKKRSPLLCQQCHSQAGHPSNVFGPDKIESRSPYLLAKSCLNCHSQVHGSNHPSGVKLMR